MHATKSTAAAAVNAAELRALRERDAQATVIARAPRIGDAK